MTFNQHITNLYSNKLFNDMCRRYGHANHEDLKSEVMTILLELSEEKKQQIIDSDYLLPYAIQTARYQTSPKNWTKFRACDYGYGSYSAVIWFAVTPSDQLVIYRELYVSKVLAKDLAHLVLQAEENDGVIRYGVLDSSCWAKRGDTGPSIAETMIIEGCRWRPADRSAGSRVAGKQQLHKRLQTDPFTEQPRLVITSNCVNTIAQLPIIPLDKKNPEDIDTKAEDHIYDAIRYGIMSRPRSSLFDYNPLTTTHAGMRSADPVFGY